MLTRLGALPVGKSKLQKTSISAKKEDSGSTDDEFGFSDEIFHRFEPTGAQYMKKKSAQSRKSEPAPLTREDEYDEDPGRMESQSVTLDPPLHRYEWHPSSSVADLIKSKAVPRSGRI